MISLAYAQSSTATTSDFELFLPVIITGVIIIAFILRSELKKGREQKQAKPQKPQPNLSVAQEPSVLVYCRDCGKQISRRAATCPNCGAPQQTPAEAHHATPDRQVSFGWTLLFGGFYLMYKGWFKSGLAAIAVSFMTGMIAWFIVPFFAQRMVNALDKPA